MGDFSGSPKWKLINDFTIHEDRNLRDRPYMLTSVPKTLDIDVTSFEIIRYIEWPHNYGQDKPEQYADKTYIKFSGDLHDKITVFHMAEGEIAKFRTVTDATIRPLPSGLTIGGKHKATVYDGIGYSGMSSKDVPKEGLMEDEPGRLYYFDEVNEEGREPQPASLYAEIFLDEDKFSRLVASLSLTAKPVHTFKLRILAELFETEMSASLSEGWMPHDYGLLMRGDKRHSSAGTAARIESLSISTGNNKLQGDDASEDDAVDGILGVADRSAAQATPDLNKALLKYQRWIFVALIVLIIVTAIQH